MGSLDATLADLRDDVHLLVSELVSNSVLHAEATQVELYASTDPAGVRIEVTDPGPGFDESDRREPSYTGDGGFGLLIVDKVANRWGAVHNGSARVWFEIDRSSASRADRNGQVPIRRFSGDGDSRFHEPARG